jgi:hypothetical protein
MGMATLRFSLVDALVRVGPGKCPPSAVPPAALHEVLGLGRQLLGHLNQAVMFFVHGLGTLRETAGMEPNLSEKAADPASKGSCLHRFSLRCDGCSSPDYSLGF